MGTIGHREPCFYYTGKRALGNCNQDKSSSQEKRFFSFFLRLGANFHKAFTMLTEGLSVTKIQDPKCTLLFFFFFFSFFLASPGGMQDLSSPTRYRSQGPPTPRSEWMRGVLTTGPPGNSLKRALLYQQQVRIT